jgi:glyoxylate utilization-related uncharacterized protein
MVDIHIEATLQNNQRSIKVTSTSNLTTITELVLNFYIKSYETYILYETYTLTVPELLEFDSNGEITLTFEDMFGDEYIQDNWYVLRAIGNSGDFVSNYDGFGVYTWVKTKVYEQINSLHTPEIISTNIENLFLKKMLLEGIEELDNSTIVSRETKFKKRLAILTKMLS